MHSLGGRLFTRHVIRCLLACALPTLGVLALAAPLQAQQTACDQPANEIVAENCKPGTHWSIWDTDGDGSIQGFATEISVDQGERVDFKIDTPSSNYRLDIYRMGYYGGLGARKVDTVQRAGAQSQPACATDTGTGLVDCSNWAVSASWNVPPTAVTGIYFAHLVRQDGTAGENHVVFVVRDDDGASDLLFQTSDTTWQAYNAYGGYSLYGGPTGRATKVSYDRPFTTRTTAPEDWVFNAEYPMVRWLERNGYDVSYFTGVDSDRLGAELREHRAFLSVGHDEYWSGAQRRNVEAARDAGVHLAFFSGNEVFWKTRWEHAHRTLVSYKETHGDKTDPTDVWTGTWRDARPFNPEGAQPENALTGTAFTVNAGTVALEVPAADGKLRFWRNSSVAAQQPGQTATLTDGTVGYEWDEDLDNGVRPAGLMHLSTTTAEGVEKLQDYVSTYAPGTATHTLTLYRDGNGADRDALVFGAGTVQWSWGLDSMHLRGDAPASPAMQQGTANLFADMGVQPATRQPELSPAAASTDAVAPVSAITSPPRSVTAGSPVTITGTATDTGGRVAAVEVSHDGGSTWHPAEGRETWSYSWTPSTSGAPELRSRAVDDSGLLEGDQPDAGAGATPSLLPVHGTGSPDGGAAQRPNPFSRLRIRTRRVRIGRDGAVRIRLSCPPGEQSCLVQLRLRAGGRVIGRRSVTLATGQTRRVAVPLNRGARRAIRHRHSLRAVAIAVVRNQAGGKPTTSRKPIRILAR
jgi:hypothetical protein